MHTPTADMCLLMSTESRFTRVILPTVLLILLKNMTYRIYVSMIYAIHVQATFWQRAGA